MFKIVRNILIDNSILRSNEFLTTSAKTNCDKKTLIILNIISKRKKVTTASTTAAASTSTNTTTSTAKSASPGTSSAVSSVTYNPGTITVKVPSSKITTKATEENTPSTINVNENPNSMTNYKRITKNTTMSMCNNATSTSTTTINNNKKSIDLTNKSIDNMFSLQQNMLMSARRWEDTQLGELYRGQTTTNKPRISIDGTPIVFMSYNILAQDLLDCHNFLYQYHDPRALIWSHRYDRLMSEIVEMNPQILCMQEVEEGKLGQLCSGLGQFEYDYIFKKRTGYKSDGCAIFYDTSLFDLVEEHSVEYYQPNVEILNRENVAVIAKLSLKSDPSIRIVVATTHLLYNPRRQDVRLAQVQVLLAELDRISYDGQHPNGSPKHTPIILSGDFNLQPFTAPYQLITNGYLKYDKLEYKTLEYGCNGARENGPTLLPRELGITDNCQHVNIAQKNIKCKTKLHHSLNNSEPNQISIPKNMPFNRGYLKHKLNLQSVYRHHMGTRCQEASTTHQNTWITVDYIFYSHIFNGKYGIMQEGNLKLLSRYILPSVQQCTQIGSIPNLYVGSDHLSTAASFLLTPNNYSKL